MASMRARARPAPRPRGVNGLTNRRSVRLTVAAGAGSAAGVSAGGGGAAWRPASMRWRAKGSRPWM